MFHVRANNGLEKAVLFNLGILSPVSPQGRMPRNQRWAGKAGLPWMKVIFAGVCCVLKVFEDIMCNRRNSFSVTFLP